jgi:hypothetical protein
MTWMNKVLLQDGLQNYFLRTFRVDMEWLDSVNAERKKEQGDRVSCETFEIIMDRLEKDWFDLVRSCLCILQFSYLNCTDRQRICRSQIWLCHPRIRRAQFATTRRERTRMQLCFVMGVILPYIRTVMVCRIFLRANGYVASVPSRPKHRWYAGRLFSSEGALTLVLQSCILCPNEGGAFKQTVLGDWVHLLCAIWIPETRVMNETFMEPITDADKIPKQRWKLVCCQIAITFSSG